MSFEISKIRADFPILSRTVNDKPLVYLDKELRHKSRKLLLMR